MKKMPCLLERDFTDRRRPKLLGTVTPGCEWVLNGEGRATRKWDGTACLVREGRLYKRYDVDAKRGKTAPPGFEPAQEPDSVTGHWPGWLPVDVLNPASPDVWHALAWWRAQESLTRLAFTFGGAPKPLADGTYELVGPRINSNNEALSEYRFVRHGADEVRLEARSVEAIRTTLERLVVEGIVFWRSDEPDCEKVKIRRDDFGLAWPVAR